MIDANDIFLSNIRSGQADKVKEAILAFHRYSIKVRDRRRVAAIDQ